MQAASQPDGSLDGSSDSSGGGGQQRLDTVPGSEGRKQTEHDIRQGRGAAPQRDQKRSGEASFLPSSKGIVLRSSGEALRLRLTPKVVNLTAAAPGTCMLRSCQSQCGSTFAGGMIIAFRGTEAFNLLNWWAHDPAWCCPHHHCNGNAGFRIHVY